MSGQGARRAFDPIETDAGLTEALRNRVARAQSGRILRFQLGMGVAGFAVGLAVVVPVAFWLSGAGGVDSLPAARAPQVLSGFMRADTQAPILRSVPQLAERETSDRPAAEVTRAAPADGQASGDAPAANGDALAQVRELIKTGAFEAARQALSRPNFAGNGEAIFVLAETYDPNVLAAMGAKGVTAQAAEARRLYGQALILGVGAARKRLDALQ